MSEVFRLLAEKDIEDHKHDTHTVAGDCCKSCTLYPAVKHLDVDNIHYKVDGIGGDKYC